MGKCFGRMVLMFTFCGVSTSFIASAVVASLLVVFEVVFEVVVVVLVVVVEDAVAAAKPVRRAARTCVEMASDCSAGNWPSFASYHSAHQHPPPRKTQANNTL